MGKVLSEAVSRSLGHLLPHVLHTHGWAPTRGHLADTRTAALRPAHAVTRHKLTPICAHPQRSRAYAPFPQSPLAPLPKQGEMAEGKQPRSRTGHPSWKTSGLEDTEVVFPHGMGR